MRISRAALAPMLTNITPEPAARFTPRRSVVAVLATVAALSTGLLVAVRAPADETTAISVTTGTSLDADFDPFDPAPSTIEIIGSGPFGAQSAVYDPFDDTPYVLPVVAPAPASPKSLARRSASDLFDASARGAIPAATAGSLQRLILHQAAPLPAPQNGAEETLPDPCFGALEKRPTELTINLAMPSGEFPHDYAAACWQQIDAQAGSFPGLRAWPMFNYQWNATAFCHRPLYFEEVNLERYGYGCCSCLQPAVSAAHFFGTTAALPYCMVANCPNECVYTLGYYRPGSCPPWQRNWPPCIGVK